MPLLKILESRVTVSVLEAVEKMFYGYCRIYFYANRTITLTHGTNTHSYIIGSCLRLMGLKAYWLSFQKLQG